MLMCIDIHVYVCIHVCLHACVQYSLCIVCECIYFCVHVCACVCYVYYMLYVFMCTYLCLWVHLSEGERRGYGTRKSSLRCSGDLNTGL